MEDRDQAGQGTKNRCPTIDDLYRYATLPDGARIRDLELHLSNCPRCRQELAEVLKLLHPEPQDAFDAAHPPSEAGIARPQTLVRDAARKGKKPKRLPPWTRWAVAAAAAVVLLGAGTRGLRYYEERSRALDFFEQAKAHVERVYAGGSPDDLRLDLPFRSAVASRAATGESSVTDAEVPFSQAIAVRPDMSEARLGLAFVYLSASHFSKARDQFQIVLDMGANRSQALIGRGVAEYGEGKRAKDSMERQTLLRQALADFDSVLKDQPGSAEARYNRVWVLYETGRHREALAEIEAYLSRESDSNWAARLKDLQTRIRLAKPEAVDKEVDRAARNRDAAALAAMVHAAPEAIPAALRSALKKSLRTDRNSAAPGDPSPIDLRWAAETMEEAYGSSTGDHSWIALLSFYDHLTRTQRGTKQSLDERFDQVVQLHRNGQMAAALRGSGLLEPEYSRLQDYWQLFNIHHLRGNCFFWQADFGRAEAEYSEMRRYADLTGAPECRAKAIAALLAAYADQIRPDEVRAHITELREVAERYRLDAWKAFADEASASLHMRLNQLEESAQDYSTALGFAYRNRDERLLERLLEKLFLIMDRLGRSEDARRLCAEAVEMMGAFEQETGQSNQTELAATRLNLLYRQGEFALRMDDFDQAESFFKKALAAGPQEMHELECRSRLGLAQVCLAKKRFGEAKPLLDESVALATVGNYAELGWQARFLQGKMHREVGDAAGALAAFSQSVDILDRMRGRIRSGDLRQQFLTRRFDPYQEIVSIFCHELHDNRKAFEFAGRAKSMTLREYLGSSTRTWDTDTETVARSLGALSIDYFFTSDELLAFVSGSNGVKVVELPCSHQELEQDVQSFLASIKSGDETAFGTLSRRLYDKLLDPVLRQAGGEGGNKLLIFPDGPLHILPFGGLKDPRGRYLLEDYTLSYAPSPSVLRHCLSLERGSAASRSRTMLLLDGSANLAGAGDELARLSMLYGGTSRIAGARDLASLGRFAADAEIIHFAGHGAVVDGKPALMLGVAPSPVMLGSEEIGSWRLSRSRLVTLAGCDTGIGPQAEGETPWGLIPAFLKAGAPALIVSLLPLDDSSSANVTSRFYEGLANNSLSKALALQKAQLALLASARAAGRLNPALWVPYVLVGDPR